MKSNRDLRDLEIINFNFYKIQYYSIKKCFFQTIILDGNVLITIGYYKIFEIVLKIVFYGLI